MSDSSFGMAMGDDLEGGSGLVVDGENPPQPFPVLHSKVIDDLKKMMAQAESGTYPDAEQMQLTTLMVLVDLNRNVYRLMRATESLSKHSSSSRSVEGRIADAIRKGMR